MKKYSNTLVVLLLIILGIAAVWMLSPYFFDREPVDYELQLTSIEAGQAISSPVEVVGRAHKNWFYQNEFPVEVQNDNEEVIGAGVAKVRPGSSPDQDGFLPFTATIEFNAEPGTMGTLVLMRSNPELKHNNFSTLVPVQF